MRFGDLFVLFDRRSLLSESENPSVVFWCLVNFHSAALSRGLPVRLSAVSRRRTVGSCQSHTDQQLFALRRHQRTRRLDGLPPLGTDDHPALFTTAVADIRRHEPAWSWEAPPPPPLRTLMADIFLPELAKLARVASVSLAPAGHLLRLGDTCAVLTC